MTYGRYYWDLPYQPERYSYPRMANDRGYATLAIDRIGNGKSWHPLSALVTYDSNVDVLHQVIQAVRNGQLGTRFEKVVLIGHSLGSVIAYNEAGIHQDVDALIITGASHVPEGPNIATKVRLNMIPAALDPKFAHSGYDPGYSTTRPGARKIFYHLPNADPKVIELDEKLKETYNDAELATAFTYLPTNASMLPATSPSKRINIPTLTIVGDHDPFFCRGVMAADCSSGDALAEFERPFFGPDAVVETKVFKNVGHNLNLERTAPESNKAILDFIDRHVGANR